MAKDKKRQKRHRRVRGEVSGTEKKPRLSIFKSNKFSYAQIINDETQETLVSADSREVIEKDSDLTKTEAAKKTGELLAQRAKDEDIEKVVFDRGGYAYHGRVEALAEGARSKGLNF